MEKQPSFFDFAAQVGLTKHMGGVVATETLAALCQISEGKYILDVGCGAGVTPCFIASKYSCKVMGVDILPAMIEKSRERAQRAGLTGQVELRVADAQELPFEDNLFDTVITESVTAFPADKQKAVNEYARVVKPGGYVGLNESTWLKTPPPPEMIAWASQDLGANVAPLTPKEWTGMMETAGLKMVDVKVYPVNIGVESRGIFQRYGFGGMMGVFGRMLSLYIKNPTYRKFVQNVQKEGVAPENIEQFFGYGLFVGKKNEL